AKMLRKITVQVAADFALLLFRMDHQLAHIRPPRQFFYFIIPFVTGFTRYVRTISLFFSKSAEKFLYSAAY
ncbi:MAG: hypothetical protein PUJ35_11510, partial [Ruminococcus bromii]|nr:hypothetical protein [Ruminococcus bromii]